MQNMASETPLEESEQSSERDQINRQFGNTTFKRYSPCKIFGEEQEYQEMTVSSNHDLVTSFYLSRKRNVKRQEPFKCNAGAVQLYNKCDGSKYIIRGQKNKEYNYISTAVIIPGPSSTNRYTSYGHTERVLMRNVLYDLIDDDEKSQTISKEEIDMLRFSIEPRDHYNEDEKERFRNDLIKLYNERHHYKKYLVEKKVIVKMWSERGACQNTTWIGGNCYDFICDIFPEGSHFGYFVDNCRNTDYVAEMCRFSNLHFEEHYREYSYFKWEDR